MMSLTTTVRRRLKDDFELALMTLFGAAAALALTPFVVYRASVGEVGGAMADACAVLSICVPIAYAWRTGDTRRAGIALSILVTLSCAAITVAFGARGVLWTYVVMLTNFAITGRRWALGLNTLLLVAVVAGADALGDGAERTSFVITAALVTLFAYISAKRTGDQRRQLERLALLDSLTGVPNRRLMEHDLEAAVLEHRRDGAAYGLAIFDVDFFKGVNDEFGHAAGDRVIADLASILRDGLRSRDRVYRFGGEEFVVLLPAPRGPADVARAAERLHGLARTALRSPGGEVTVSIGVAMLEGTEDWQDWFSRADNALFQAKREGRDRLVVAGPVAAESVRSQPLH